MNRVGDDLHAIWFQMQVPVQMPILEHVAQGGAAIAVIVVVILFLRAREKSDMAVKDIVSTFADETRRAREDYREHVTGIMDAGLRAHAETREAIRGLDATLASFRHSAAASSRTMPPDRKEV